MKLLACSDFQLGAGADYGAKPGDRLRDQALALARVAQAAKEHDVDFLLFAGDAFQHRRPSVDELLCFRHWLSSLADENIPVFAIPGNHDIRGPGQPSALSLFTDRLSLYEKPEVVRLQEKAGLACLPWAHPATWRLEAPRIGRSGDLASYAAAIVEVAGGLRAQLEDGVPSVLLAHWAISGTSLPSGLPASALREPVLPLDDLAAQGWSLIVSGHIHRAQAAGPVLVPGSPAVCDFGEADLRHGCFVVEMRESVAMQFVPIEGRRFVTLEGEYREGLALSDEVADAVVRVRLQLARGDEPDLGAIRQSLYDMGAHKVWSIEADRPRDVRRGTEELEPDEGPLELFGRWLEANEVSAGEAGLLLDKLSDYLEEER